MAKLRINGDSSGYVDLSAPNAASSSTLDLDQVPQKNVANTFSADMSFGDNNKVNLGAGNDLQLYHDGSNNYIKSAAAGWLNVPLSGNGMTVADGNFSNIFFKIDSSGRVVTPKQPAFHADAGAAQTVAGTVQFTGVMTNNGNHYNSSTYTFTAPVTGTYKFSARIMKAQDATVDFHFRVNGSQVCNNLYDTATATNQLNSGTINMVRHLNSSDSVTVYSASTSGTNWIHAGHREFTGFLIG
jgi:hypothetical protein